MLLAISLGKRTLPHTSYCPSVIDLAFVFRSLTPEVSVKEGISGHQMLSLIFGNQNQNVSRNNNLSRVPVKQYRRANGEIIIDHLEIVSKEFSWDYDTSSYSSWLKYKQAIEFWEANFIPTKWKRAERKKPWSTRGIIYIKRKLQRMPKKRKIIPHT